MKAMILAAGRGERMRPLTDHIPKPLLKVGGKSLIVYHIENLAKAGFRNLVINHAHLGRQVESELGNGSKWDVFIKYSPEEKALETGGGIYKALPLLEGESFLVVNGDIWTDYDFSGLCGFVPEGIAHLIMIDNPEHHPQGDFAIQDGRLVDADNGGRFTFSGIGVYRPSFFSECTGGAFPLAPLLKQAMEKRMVSGEYFGGAWTDVGTPQRLAELEAGLQAN